MPRKSRVGGGGGGLIPSEIGVGGKGGGRTCPSVREEGGCRFILE